MQQQEVRSRNDVRMWNRAAVETGADGEPAPASCDRLRQVDQLVDARRLDEPLFVLTVVALVGDLDQDVAVALAEQPFGRLSDRASDRGIISDCLLYTSPSPRDS